MKTALVGITTTSTNVERRHVNENLIVSDISQTEKALVHRPKIYAEDQEMGLTPSSKGGGPCLAIHPGSWKLVLIQKLEGAGWVVPELAVHCQILDPDTWQ